MRLWSLLTILKQINIFIERVVGVAVDCKSDSRQGKAKVFIIFLGQKSETAMAHKNKTRNIQPIQHVRICYAYCFG